MERPGVDRSLAVLAAAGALALLGGGCGGAGDTAATGDSAASVQRPQSRYAGSVLAGRPLRAPDFALRDQDGRRVRLRDQRGKLVFVTFLYTHCVDVCPAIASQLNAGLRELGPTRRDVSVLAVSVDPRGDTPRAVRRFVRSRRLLPQFRYLTGTRRELEPVWRDYHLAVDPQSGKVGHTAYELLVDRRGIERLIYGVDVTAQAVTHDVRALGS